MASLKGQALAGVARQALIVSYADRQLAAIRSAAAHIKAGAPVVDMKVGGSDGLSVIVGNDKGSAQ